MEMVAYIVRFLTAVLPSKIGVVRVLLRVAIFEPPQGCEVLDAGSRQVHVIRTFIKCSRAKVETEIRFCANHFAPLHELIGAKLVRLNA